METATPLDTELRLFEEHRQEWSQANRGKYKVILGETILDGFFDEYADAFKAGLAAFGAGRSFLVKQVWRTEPIYFVAWSFPALEFRGTHSTSTIPVPACRCS